MKINKLKLFGVLIACTSVVALSSCSKNTDQTNALVDGKSTVVNENLQQAMDSYNNVDDIAKNVYLYDLCNKLSDKQLDTVSLLNLMDKKDKSYHAAFSKYTTDQIMNAARNTPSYEAAYNILAGTYRDKQGKVVFMAEGAKDQYAKALGIKTYNRDNFNKSCSQINQELKKKLSSKTKATSDKA